MFNSFIRSVSSSEDNSLTFNQFQEQLHYHVLEYLFNLVKSTQTAISCSSQYSGTLSSLIPYSFFFFFNQPSGKLIFVSVLFKGISQSFKAIISLQRSQQSFPKEALFYLFLNTAANSKVLFRQTVIKRKTQLPDYHVSVELKHMIYWYTPSPRF